MIPTNLFIVLLALTAVGYFALGWYVAAAQRARKERDLEIEKQKKWKAGLKP